MASTITCMSRGFGILKKQIKEGYRPEKPLRQGVVTPSLKVPSSIPMPFYARTGGKSKDMTKGKNECIHTKEELIKMREACRIAAVILQQACDHTQPGITTEEIDRFVFEACVQNNAYPSPLNYGRFPKSVCTSVNECVCHGVPDNRKLLEGDIINIDVTIYKDGHHGDCSKTIVVGKTQNKHVLNLIEGTEKAMDQSIKICQPGVRYSEIGGVIEDIAYQYGLVVVKDYAGHGVGRTFHGDPYILHHKNDWPGEMYPYQTFTIEPIFVLGEDKLKTWKDNWTTVTQDGTYAAQFEHTILITENGHEILTQI